MKYITKTLDFQLDHASVITLGKFDGLHRGHQKLVNKALEIGKQGYETVVFTFDVSPLVKLGSRIKRTLLTNEERRNLLERMNVDCLIECPFVQELIQMEPEEFIEQILVRRLRASFLVVGPDFRFGYQRKGTSQVLQEFSSKYGYKVVVLEKEQNDHREISSTWIRELIREGRMENVNDLLGYPYFVKGTVVRGRQLGRTWGLPTINQIPSDSKLLPPFGVYASRTTINGKTYYGISNVGVKSNKIRKNWTISNRLIFKCKNTHNETNC